MRMRRPAGCSNRGCRSRLSESKDSSGCTATRYPAWFRARAVAGPIAAKHRSRCCSSNGAPKRTALALVKMMTSNAASGPSCAAVSRRLPTGLISTAGRRRVCAPSISSSRHSGIACCSGRVTRTPTPCNAGMGVLSAQALEQRVRARGQHSLRQQHAERGRIRGEALRPGRAAATSRRARPPDPRASGAARREWRARRWAIGSCRRADAQRRAPRP